MEKKKSIILTVVAVATLIALVVGATFAYFQATGGTGASADVRVTTYTTDLLTFTTGNAIAIYADQANFADGLGNQTGETFARAHLLANSKTNTATANYYVYLNVTNNTFEYTQEDETAELLLQVTDPNGTEVTTLSGLEYKTVMDGKGTEVKGFDVTAFDGLVTIANNYEIVANNETTQTWTVKLVFVNLDAEQTANAGHSLSADLVIQKEIIPFHEICNDNTLACYVAKQYTGTQGNNNVYYHDSSLENGAGDNSYRYAGGNYKLTKKAIAEGFSKIDSYSDATSNETLINFYCNDERQGMLTTCNNTKYFTLQYEGNNTQYTSYKDAENQAISDGYLVDDVNNYVCFGSDKPTCPDDNLYRIIGVFGDQVKLIKWDYATSDLLGEDGEINTLYTAKAKYYYKGNNDLADITGYYWNKANYDDTYLATGYYNDWNYSELNKTNLNRNFIENIGEQWAAKIAEHIWVTGGNTEENIDKVPTKMAYINEITNPSTQVTSTTESKIGLMYVSDYGFAASPSAWTRRLVVYHFDDVNGNKINEKNWMFMGLYEWTITRSSSYPGRVYHIDFLGYVYDRYDANYMVHGVRPVFYLNSDVAKVGNNTGTKSDPIRIN